MSIMICGNCGTVAEPKSITKGSFAVEIILWLCFILPGMLYSVWRLASRHKGCPKCGQNNMIPLDSPRGIALRKPAAGN